ncbi:MAG TPA: hypothetical protein VLG50_06925 [Candidatus Saccharimonadales bacterium]|nr:hypothetical protein [Candidatus Saccharimonadales bacterium]
MKNNNISLLQIALVVALVIVVLSVLRTTRHKTTQVGPLRVTTTKEVPLLDPNA